MTLRAGKSGRYRYYTCSTKARQGETGCTGRTVPVEKLDTLVADHIERRLLQPTRLEEILSSVLDRREERAERRATHIAELRKRTAKVDAKLERHGCPRPAPKVKTAWDSAAPADVGLPLVPAASFAAELRKNLAASRPTMLREVPHHNH